MSNKAIKSIVVLSTLAICAGCAVFEPPQAYPREWKQLEAASAATGESTHALSDAERRKLSAPPANLDESIRGSFALLRDYTLKASASDGVPQHIGNLLIGLTSFGAYRGITHPSAKMTAGLAAVGSAAYAAGSGIDWRRRADAYTHGVEGLICLLTEAQAFVIVPLQDAGDKDVGAGRRQLAVADQDVAAKAAELDRLLGEHAALNQHYLVAQGTTTKSACNRASWDSQLCKPMTGNDHAGYLRHCKEVQAQHARVCATRKLPTVYSAPAAEVRAVFAAASAARERADTALKLSGRMQSNSYHAGQKLWSGTLSVMKRVTAELQGTGYDLAELMAKAHTGQKGEARETLVGALQAGTSTPPPSGAATRVRLLDKETAENLADISRAVQALRAATLLLERYQRANATMPELNPAKFDACISPEAKLAQALATANVPAPAAEENTYISLDKMSIPERAGLDLPADASQAMIERRLRTCQKALGLPEDGRLGTSMSTRLLAGQCKGIKWD